MPRGRPRNYDPDEVLEAAVQVFWDRGFDEAALEDVIERSGISRQSLYKVFGSKADLFRVAVRRYAEVSEEAWKELLGSDPSPLASLRAFLGRWTSCPSDLEGRGCLMVASVNAVSGRDTEFAAYAGEHMERQRTLLEGVIRAAVEAGELRDDVDPRALSTQLLAQVLGMATLAHIPGGAGAIESAAKGALAELDALAA